MARPSRTGGAEPSAAANNLSQRQMVPVWRVGILTVPEVHGALAVGEAGAGATWPAPRSLRSPEWPNKLGRPPHREGRRP